MRFPDKHSDSIADLVHEKSVEILKDVGFCVTESETLSRLESAGFPTNHESQMVRLTQELIDKALFTLAQRILSACCAGPNMVYLSRFSAWPWVERQRRSHY
jgi:trimethylamine:corrinoid methyltransferase-like protein